MLGGGRNQRGDAGGPLGIQHHKEKKKARKQQEEQSDSDGFATSQDERLRGESLLEECDEAVWQLDEAQEVLAAEANQTSISNIPSSPGEVTALADDFIRTHRTMELPVPSGRRDLPVVITQRRPKARSRGFIQAYAPLLEDAGIDQPAFLNFIDRLNKAVRPSP